MASDFCCPTLFFGTVFAYTTVKDTGVMNREQIMDLIRGLAQSTGWYGRLYESIMEMDKDSRDRYFTWLEEQNFKSDLDFIVFYEEGRRLDQ